jgi:EAL domain-containing protein (putative c-di-GMP-specific phosphodiesterase class I)
MNRHLAERLVLESALRQAIPSGELILHYQPQIHLSDGKVRSCEALVRWNHLGSGLIHPQRFIPLAEETGLILPLGRWVFTEACRQQVRWNERGIRISVNISAAQFRWEGFIGSITNTLAETGADPRQMALEFTGNALVNLNDTLLERIFRLKGMGFGIFLDDFGTGYSSLSSLKRLPISGLKLDRSLIEDIPHDVDNCAITTVALLIARELGMKVVAKGVENQSQVTFLQERQCGILQGYYYSKPLDAYAFEQWLEDFDNK